MELKRSLSPVGTVPSEPLLSVVVPAYRSSRFVFRALNSLKKSTLPLQVIVVENGSSELVAEELERALGPNELNFSTLAQSDLSSARNHGLSLAKGKWILFLDSDDWVDIDVYIQLASDDLADGCSVLSVKMVEEKTPNATIATQSRHRGKGRLTQQTGPGYLLGALLRDQYSPVTGCYLFRRIDLEQWGLQFAPGFLHEDHAFTASAILKSECLGSSKSIGLYKLIRADSLTRTATPTESIRGYAHAIKELEGLDRRNEVTVSCAATASALLQSRLTYILENKRLLKNSYRFPIDILTRARYLSIYAVLYIRGLFRVVVRRCNPARLGVESCQ
jgi:glycosyltransferase involved in cell wall biosynthesis